MSDMKGKLDALLSNKGIMSGSEWRSKVEDMQRRRAEGEFEISTVIPGEHVGDEESGFYLVREEFPLETPHGCVRLANALDAAPEHIALSASDDELAGFDARTAVFVDAETSGLAGGAGTVAFLVGLGYFEGDVFRLEQCFMRDYDDEEPMLEYVEGLFRGRESVVSYNGKSFDLPLLRTRFIQNRLRFPGDSLLHYDLVHAARRFWRRRLRDCSLGNIERAILGLQRHGDVPSHLIPELWFTYLRSRDARPLKGVFYHHKMDILSLAALMGRLACCLAEPDGGGFEHAEDRLSLVRIHFNRKEYGRVVRHGRQLLESDKRAVARHECLEMMGLAYKRLQRWQEMEDTWALLLDECPRHLLARLELAKHHEHRTRNLVFALRLCEQAMQFYETRDALDRITEGELTQRGQFEHRLERIRKKLRRAGQGEAD